MPDKGGEIAPFFIVSSLSLNISICFNRRITIEPNSMITNIN